MDTFDKHRPPATDPVGRPAPDRPVTVVVRDRVGFWRFAGRTVTVAAVAVPTLVVAAVLSVVVLLGTTGALLFGDTSDDPFGGTESVGGSEGAEAWLLVVPVDGVITSYGDAGLIASTGGQETRDLLLDAAEDPRVRAVVVEFSTPGGTIPGAMDIAAGIESVQAAGKPVVAFVRDLSASGGVWAMSGADVVVAHPGSLVGSVGVSFGPLRQYDQPVAVDDGFFGGGVTTTGGVEEYFITAGEGKDLGNPYRPATDSELEHLQAQVDEQYGKFVEHIVTTRDIAPSIVRGVLGASIMTAPAAVEAGLVDWTGGRAAAWRAAAESARLEVFDVRTIPDNRGLFTGLLGSTGAESTRGATDATTARSTLCGRPQTLAYYGTVGSLCR